MAKNGEADKLFDALAAILCMFFVVNAKVFYNGIKTLCLRTIAGMAIWTFLVSLPAAAYGWHLSLLHRISPELFHYDLIMKWWSYGTGRNLLALMGSLALFRIWVGGAVRMVSLRRYQSALDTVSLKNGRGDRAKVVDAWTSTDGFKVVRVSSRGIGFEKYGRAKGDLAAAFGIPVDEIERSGSVGYVDIFLGPNPLPKRVSFEEVAGTAQGKNSFVIGRSKEGIVREALDNLPHMLIAGTTGGGKSVFFKQALLGLLRSTGGLQMYLIDLKGGLEFRSFARLPNVRVVKTAQEAVALLEAVKGEMEERFEYLESTDREKILPRRDGRDRIVVGIDEASVLYSAVSRGSDDHELIVRARNLTEHIAKLSRAAAIHLILATQKVTKETIDTRIQENISGRMCFKLNTPEGSVRVLGNTSACDLPNIPGRGIWQNGNESTEVQAPDIDSRSLKEELGAVASDYSDGQKKLCQRMLETERTGFGATKKGVSFGEC